MTTFDQTNEDLRAAANLIDQHGWCQWTTHTLDGRICLIESLERATDRDQPRINNAAHRIVEHLGLSSQDVQHRMCEINNRSDQTKEKLTAMLREIANKPVPANA